MTSLCCCTAQVGRVTWNAQFHHDAFQTRRVLFLSCLPQFHSALERSRSTSRNSSSLIDIARSCINQRGTEEVTCTECEWFVHQLWMVRSVSTIKTMLQAPKEDAIPIVRRQATVATSLPLAEILGLAIGGAALFTILIVSAIFYARKRDRRKNKKGKEVDAEARQENDVPLRSIRSPLCLSKKSSFNPFLPAEKASSAMSNEWLEDESMMDTPPMTKAQVRRLSQKGMFIIPNIRDSWPLAASIPSVPLRLLQPDPSMTTLNQAGGGGYVVPSEPKRPGRTYSRKSTTRIVVSTEESNMQRFSTSSPESATQRLTPQRRSASVSQLSTILRSTSQRLKAAHRKSLSRTLTTFGGSTGQPPANKLETPRKPANESQVGLVEPEADDGESVASSVCNSHLNSSPTPEGRNVSNPGQGSQPHRPSVTPSVESADSLCAVTTPDLVIPAALTSPSIEVIKKSSTACHSNIIYRCERSFRNDRRGKPSISSGG